MRFIPAPAGNIPSSERWASPFPVHPRACGEHNRAGLRQCERSGSSPRLRGTLGARRRHGLSRRFIPAPAGNINGSKTNGAMGTVHPRACGEHVSPSPCTMCIRGSSPRLRGTSSEADRQPVHQRFIPAPAGNMIIPKAVAMRESVHPRACGEHVLKRHRYVVHVGSSPRLRGT